MPELSSPPTVAAVLEGLDATSRLAEPGRGRHVTLVFAAATLVNATLLFAVQPMFTKLVLPLLGGTPAVWNTCLLFFQTMLLLGYLYAHLTSRWMTPGVQGVAHIVLLCISVAFIPLGLPQGVEPPAGLAMPVLWLIVLLLVSLGLPFFLLSAGAPMLQRWLASTRHPAARNPYTLYVASNAGSFLALLSYPLLVEPWLRLTDQRLWWGVVYIGLIALITAALVLALRWARPAATSTAAPSIARVTSPQAAAAPAVAPSAADTPRPESTGGSAQLPSPGGAPSSPVEGGAGHEVAPRTIVPTAAWRLRWTLLSFAPSSLLLGVTNYLSTDVAAFPLLWIVPLALYLLTFIFVFAERPPLSRRVMLALQTFVGVPLLILIATTPTRMLAAYVAVHLLGFFVTAMVCHRELADSRPAVPHLTEYYLWMSFGGALGGAFNVLVAPLAYDRILEYPFALIIAFGLRPGTDREVSRRKLLPDVALAMLLYAGMQASYRLPVIPGRWGTFLAVGVLVVAGAIVALFHRRPLRLALAAAALFLAIDERANDRRDILFQERSFFGVYKVHQWNEFHVLQHGTTTHGAQNMIAELQKEPITYYARSGPLGDVFAELVDSTTPQKVAVVGLGTGTASCYSRTAADQWTYYEIDPLVVRFARAPRLFSYLRQCAPDAQIVLGDARISLARAPDGAYDLILLDAFSSDAIPIHLLTREALALYVRKLKPDGIILYHISNRYLRLEPVLVEIARSEGVYGAIGERNPTTEERAKLHYGARWVGISRDSTRFDRLIYRRGWLPLSDSKGDPPWTDDYSNVLRVVKWRGDD